MKKKKRREWILPLIFLAGYLTAWGTILIDRQIVISEQRRLQEEVKQVRQELRIKNLIEGYSQESEAFIIWNKKAVEKMEMESGESEAR